MRCSVAANTMYAPADPRSRSDIVMFLRDRRTTAARGGGRGPGGGRRPPRSSSYRRTQPFPDRPPLKGWPRRPTPPQAKKTKPPNPPPVGKAGFEVWVLTKGGLVSVHHCRLYCTVVHVHRLGRYVEPSGACVYRYGPVTKSKLSYTAVPGPSGERAPRDCRVGLTTCCAVEMGTPHRASSSETASSHKSRQTTRLTRFLSHEVRCPQRRITHAGCRRSVVQL